MKQINKQVYGIRCTFKRSLWPSKRAKWTKRGSFEANLIFRRAFSIFSSQFVRLTVCPATRAE